MRLLAVICVIVALLRVAGVTDPVYQAVAHMLVGGLLTGWLVDRSRRGLLGLGVALSTVETVMFIWKHLP